MDSKAPEPTYQDSTESIEKSDAIHSEEVNIGKVERNVGLRIDGDDLDHEHEPKVCLPLDQLQDI